MNMLLEKHLPMNADNLSKKAESASKRANRYKTKNTHFSAAKAHLEAYNAHKSEHLKAQKDRDPDIYHYNRTANLAGLHYRKYLQHKKFTDWK